MLTIGIQPEPEDTIRRIRGIGGSEFVFTKTVERFGIGAIEIQGFEVEVGVINYGLAMDGIVGMDFLTQVGAVIDLDRMEVRLTSG